MPSNKTGVMGAAGGDAGGILTGLTMTLSSYTPSAPSAYVGNTAITGAYMSQGFLIIPDVTGIYNVDIAGGGGGGSNHSFGRKISATLNITTLTTLIFCAGSQGTTSYIAGGMSFIARSTGSPTTRSNYVPILISGGGGSGYSADPGPNGDGGSVSHPYNTRLRANNSTLVYTSGGSFYVGDYGGDGVSYPWLSTPGITGGTYGSGIGASTACGNQGGSWGLGGGSCPSGGGGYLGGFAGGGSPNTGGGGGTSYRDSSYITSWADAGFNDTAGYINIT
jgi:hypothetical protein